MINDFDSITKEKRWNTEVDRFLEEKYFSSDLIEQFHTVWTVSGHHIRAQIEDDSRLVKLLRHVLPRYSGKELVLYRGENVQRWKKNLIGLCWTTAENTARMFGSGLNSVQSGGLLIKCACKAEWIIAGPSAHSRYLGEEEYTVDTCLISNVEIIEQYDPI